MTSLALRTLAMLTMLADHLGHACHEMLPEPAYIAMRLAGRLAMPIFCFLIAEGFFHTRDLKRYAGRLLLFALVSEIPYDWFMSSGETLVRWSGQNVFFTLLLGLLAIWLCDMFALRNRTWLSLFGVLACAALAQLAQTDYGMFGVLFIFVFYCFRDRPKEKHFAFAGACLLLGLYNYLTSPNSSLTWPIILASAAAAVIPIWLYNGRKGKGGKALQIAFYVFYPAHLLLITLFVHL